MSKINSKNKIIEKVNKDILKDVKKEQIVKKKVEKKIKTIKKIKIRNIRKEPNSSLQVICEVVEILDKGYILKIIKSPTKQINMNYKVHDLIEFATFNNSYDVGDVIEYIFESPLTRESRLIEKSKVVVDEIEDDEEDEISIDDKDDKEDDKEEKEDEKDKKDKKEK